MKFKDGELVILNEKIKNGLPNRVGELAKIYCEHTSSTNYDYTVVLDNGDLNPVKESELNKLTEKQMELSKFIIKGGRAIHYPTSEEVCIQKVDYLLSKAEINFVSGGSTVVDFWTLRKLEKETDSVTEVNETNTNDLINIFFNHYKNSNDTYTIPKQLLINLLKEIIIEEV